MLAISMKVLPPVLKLPVRIASPLMIKYPVRIPVNSYKGKSQQMRLAAQAKLALAARVEKIINTQMADKQCHMFTFVHIASETGGTPEEICELLAPMGAGSHGVTVSR